MAAAEVLVADTDTAKMFYCGTCAEKRERGCVRPRRTPVIVFGCPACKGENKKCAYCKGKNELKLHRCPRAICDANIRGLVPYFWHYANTNQYPDGRGRLFQPVKMIAVFDLWMPVWTEARKKWMKEQQENV
jgi:hypothetical protein